MKTKPSVTIIMTAYNAEKVIGRQIEILQKQNYPNFGIIIVDDKSQDNTSKVVKQFKGIKLIRNKTNKGLAGSLNEGIKKSKSEIVVVMHQDMKPTSNKWLSSLIEPFKDRKVIASVSLFCIPEKQWSKFNFWHKVFTMNEFKPVHTLLGNNACAFRRREILKVGLFDNESYATAGEDIDMYHKMKEKGKIGKSWVLVEHREGIGNHRNSLKKQLMKKYQHGEARGALMRRIGFKMRGKTKMIVKSAMLLSLPIPIFNIIPLTFFFSLSIAYTIKVSEKIKEPKILLIPFAYVLADVIFQIGFLRGLLTGKQEYNPHRKN